MKMYYPTVSNKIRCNTFAIFVMADYNKYLAFASTKCPISKDNTGAFLCPLL